MKKTASLFLAMVFLLAFLLGCAAVTKETTLSGFPGIAEETKMASPDWGVAFTTNERIERYYQENFGGGFK